MIWNSSVSEEPCPIIGRIVVGPEVRVAAKRRVEGGRIHPLGDSLLLGAAPVEVGIADQIGPAGNLVTGTGDG